MTYNPDLYDGLEPMLDQARENNLFRNIALLEITERYLGYCEDHDLESLRRDCIQICRKAGDAYYNSGKEVVAAWYFKLAGDADRAMDIYFERGRTNNGFLAAYGDNRIQEGLDRTIACFENPHLGVWNAFDVLELIRNGRDKSVWGQYLAKKIYRYCKDELTQIVSLSFDRILDGVKPYVLSFDKWTFALRHIDEYAYHSFDPELVAMAVDMCKVNELRFNPISSFRDHADYYDAMNGDQDMIDEFRIKAKSDSFWDDLRCEEAVRIFIKNGLFDDLKAVVEGYLFVGILQYSELLLENGMDELILDGLKFGGHYVDYALACNGQWDAIDLDSYVIYSSGHEKPYVDDVTRDHTFKNTDPLDMMKILKLGSQLEVI